MQVTRDELVIKVAARVADRSMCCGLPSARPSLAETARLRSTARRFTKEGMT